MRELRPSILARYNLFSRSFHVNKKCLDLRRYPITYLNTIQYPCLLSRGTGGKTLALMLPLRQSGLQMLTKKYSLFHTSSREVKQDKWMYLCLPNTSLIYFDGIRWLSCYNAYLITFYVAKGERSHISLRQYRIPIVSVIFDTSII